MSNQSLLVEHGGESIDIEAAGRTMGTVRLCLFLTAWTALRTWVPFEEAAAGVGSWDIASERVRRERGGCPMRRRMVRLRGVLCRVRNREG